MMGRCIESGDEKRENFMITHILVCVVAGSNYAVACIYRQVDRFSSVNGTLDLISMMYVYVYDAYEDIHKNTKLCVCCVRLTMNRFLFEAQFSSTC